MRKSCNFVQDVGRTIPEGWPELVREGTTTLQFTYDASVREDLPELATGLLHVRGLTANEKPSA